ncbi:Cytidine and dCMP deaminase domain-containing protein 1 [Myotis brandtii]|uniref:Cytidine and dCMP deaminase domain-containing protein 1 n=1 Tax=Myotis brandtii TaxID=109478 RepID=S7P728_MYOBR|nr:Cytidine and dCMP deaminase domain-containing protein 1 [Myotis brandtii]
MQNLEITGAGRSVSTQTDSMTGQIPRLSKVNLFTLLSLWMELFPAVEGQRQKSQEKEEGKCGHLGDNEEMARVSTDKKQVKKTGLVVVKNMKIVDLHCSSEELHAGKIALIKHGSRLKNCDLYFSRKPCSACLKMIVNGPTSFERAVETLELASSVLRGAVGPPGLTVQSGRQAPPLLCMRPSCGDIERGRDTT